MVAISVGTGHTVHIAGHGLIVSEQFEIAPGISVCPAAPPIDEPPLAGTIRSTRQVLNIMVMENLSTFAIKVHNPEGRERLAADAWNSLWVFHLLALACRSPVFPLYSIAKSGTRDILSLANRNLVIQPLSALAPATGSELEWAANHYKRFFALIDNGQFSRAVRCYGNAHYLFDVEPRVMLLWAGIEGLLDVDSELRRRIALHSAILLNGTGEEKAAYFAKVKKAYDLRSRVVHGSGLPIEKLDAAYESASEILINLLRKVVMLGRVPTADELDRHSVTASVS